MKRATRAQKLLQIYLRVSIHARVKRATIPLSVPFPPLVCFNPRPREAGDADKQINLSFGKCFNPRPREAGDFFERTRDASRSRFNPRPREAGDDDPPPLAIAPLGFNPRPREAGDGPHQGNASK